jgi:hypothetical protein
MSKAFVLMNSTHQPTGVFIIPDQHTTSHYTGQLYKAAEEVGRYGMLIDVEEVGAPQAADMIRKMEKERHIP